MRSHPTRSFVYGPAREREADRAVTRAAGDRRSRRAILVLAAGLHVILGTPVATAEPEEPGAPAESAEQTAPETPGTGPTPPEPRPRIFPRTLPRSSARDALTPPAIGTRGRASRADAGGASSEATDRARGPGGPLEIRTREDDFLARLGSQTARGSGLLGRYDGLRASKALGDLARVSLEGGFPLTPSDTARFDLDRSFYTLSLDLAPSDESLTARLYSIQQRIDAERARRGIGGEIGVESRRGFGLVTVDYDVGFQDLGTLRLLASARLAERTRLNALVAARRYTGGPPAFATLERPDVTSLDQLLDRLSQSELRAPVFDREAETRTLRLGASHQLDDDVRVMADVTLERILRDSARADRAEADARQQLDYAVRATWQDLFVAESSTTMALRIAEGQDMRRYSGTLRGQYPVPLSENLRFGPDLGFEFRDLEGEWIYKPSMRFEYLRSRLRLDLSLGLEIADARLRAGAFDPANVFYRVGYRYDF